MMTMQCDHLDIRDGTITNGNTWDACPPEVLLMILEYFNVKTHAQTLLNCLAVNRRWWHLVSSLIEHHIGFLDFLKHILSDEGASFKKRTALSSISDVLLNLCLWKDIQFICISEKYNYDVTEVINVNIYKDQVIVVTDNNVKYFNVKNHKLIKTLPIVCSNFDENDYMFVKKDPNILEEMTLYGKVLPEQSTVEDKFKMTIKINLFRIYDNCCYYTSYNKFCIFIERWENCKWQIQLVGRYFGHGVITEIVVQNHDILALLNWGGMLLADLGTCKLKLMSRKKTSVIFDIPWYATKSMLFESYGTVVTVPCTYPLKLTNKNEYWILECPDLTCSFMHANMLLIGYRNGKVEIYNPELFARVPRQLKPEVTLTVQSLAPDYELFNPSVTHIDVVEVKGAHVLVIATSVYVHQVTLDHRIGESQAHL